MAHRCKISARMLAAIVFCGTISFTACTKKSGAAADGAGSQYVTTVSRQDWTSTVECSGEIKPVRVLEIKSKASGKILRMPVETGEEVAAGALLAQIDTTETATVVREQAAALQFQKTQLDVARRKQAQAKQLFAKGMISQDDYDAARLDYARDQSTLTTTEALLAEAREELSETTLRAPTAGRVLEKDVQEGQIISSATSGLSEGTTLLKMADLSTVRVRVLMDQTDLGKIKIGQEATIVPDAYPGRKFHGQVARVEPMPTTDKGVKYFPVLVDLDNRQGLLLPGMDCDVTVAIAHLSSVITVSTDAVVNLKDASETGSILGVAADSVKAALGIARGDSTASVADSNAVERSGGPDVGAEEGAGTGTNNAAIVFVADSSRHTIRPVPVHIGMQDWNRTEIISGLGPGATAVVPPSVDVVRQFEAFRKMYGISTSK